MAESGGEIGPVIPPPPRPSRMQRVVGVVQNVLHRSYQSAEQKMAAKDVIPPAADLMHVRRVAQPDRAIYPEDEDRHLRREREKAESEITTRSFAQNLLQKKLGGTEQEHLRMQSQKEFEQMTQEQKIASLRSEAQRIADLAEEGKNTPK